mmetsp:Transcript_9039/g.22096  ORF Transcript_9039/g.22096 Transcript_9039/m.22096 type:complete len:91 (+) Transcript_9039:3445-3717(+)
MASSTVAATNMATSNMMATSKGARAAAGAQRASGTFIMIAVRTTAMHAAAPATELMRMIAGQNVAKIRTITGSAHARRLKKNQMCWLVLE